MTHTMMCQGSIPSWWSSREVYPSSMSLPFKWKISFGGGRSRRQYVPRVRIPTGNGPFCVDFYTHGT